MSVMRRTTVIILAVAGAIVALGVAYLLTKDVLWRAAGEAMSGNPAYERSFNEAFEKSMREQCISSALSTAAQRGKTGPEIDAEVRRRCECAVEVARPMPVAEKAALQTDREKLAKLAAEVIRRCGG